MKDYVLDLDVGNSFTKWRVGAQRGSVVTGELPKPTGEITRVRVSAVAASESQLSEQIFETYHLQSEFARTTRTLAGVRNGYDDITQLGVDRWLALVAAWQRVHADVLVFDLGTAMTADYVRADGTHLGGYIVPSPNAMRSILRRSTRDVHVRENNSTVLRGMVPARNTDDAVNGGLAHMQYGWVKSCIEVGAQIFGCEPNLIRTGGELTFSQSSGLSSIQFFPDLVLEGLAIALP